MSALTFSSGPDLGDARVTMEKLRAKFGPLTTVVAVHAALFYFAYSGMMSRMVDAALPQAVLVSFVAPPPPPKAPPPAAPKVVPLVQLPPPVLPSVPVPVVQIAPQPNVVTVTQTAMPAEPRPVQVATVSVATAPTPAVASTPKTISTGVEYIQAPQPVYPLMSKRMGEQGRVMLRILVNEKGMPDQVQVHTSSGSARLDEAGRQAALRAQFKPHMEDGHAVAVYVIVPLNFQLSS
jgi:protein TonB